MKTTVVVLSESTFEAVNPVGPTELQYPKIITFAGVTHRMITIRVFVASANSSSVNVGIIENIFVESTSQSSTKHASLPTFGKNIFITSYVDVVIVPVQTSFDLDKATIIFLPDAVTPVKYNVLFAGL